MLEFVFVVEPLVTFVLWQNKLVWNVGCVITYRWVINPPNEMRRVNVRNDTGGVNARKRNGRNVITEVRRTNTIVETRRANVIAETGE